MKHDDAFALVVKYCPEQAGRLWNTTEHAGCDTATAVADQYADDEHYEAISALQVLATGRIPEDWESYTPEEPTT